jgi:hypothetical protein
MKRRSLHPSIIFTDIRKGVVSRENTRMMRTDSLERWHEHSTASMPCSSSDPRQQSSNSSDTCTSTTGDWNQPSSGLNLRIIRPTERSSPARRTASRRATEWLQVNSTLFGSACSTSLRRGDTLQPMATPKIRPIAAVTPIARAPPMVTRSAARPSGAPPR